MTIVTKDDLKVLLPRSGADEFWQLIRRHYAAADERAWKYLAMLALRENAGWPLDSIGLAFGHPKGHVTRCLSIVKRELRDRFRTAPEMLDLDPALDPTAPEESSPVAPRQESRARG